ncbi:hypothetical protein J437_LFUL013070 [Ladona fulva]|uniref:Uncharacterized protein n=1 Tax=Ladona fulva TaxID=123851 RepID=A0A8K0KG47_LADFU|nr:hypothetical protein J437_LFUL013070 [Ladona fulva]
MAPLVMLVMYATGQTPVEAPREGGGLAFLEEGHFLLSARSWTLALDIDLRHHLEAITLLMTDINTVLAAAEAGLKDGRGSPSEPSSELLKLADQVMKREGRTIQREAIRIFDQLWKMQDDVVPRHRSRRGLLNLGGEALKFIFGTLDDEDLQSLNSRIENLKVGNQKIVHLVKQPQSLIQPTNGRREVPGTGEDNGNDKRLGIQLENLSERFEEGQKGIVARITAIFTINSSLRMLEMILAETRAEINLFKQALETTVNGKLSPYFLSPPDLHVTLNQISLHLPRGGNPKHYGTPAGGDRDLRAPFASCSAYVNGQILSPFTVYMVCMMGNLDDDVNRISKEIPVIDLEDDEEVDDRREEKTEGSGGGDGNKDVDGTTSIGNTNNGDTSESRDATTQDEDGSTSDSQEAIERQDFPFNILSEKERFFKRFNMCGREVKIALTPLNTGNPLVWFENAMEKLLEYFKSKSVQDADQLGMSIRSDATPDKEISISFRRSDRLKPEVISTVISKVVQSNDDFLTNDDNLCLARSIGGPGHTVEIDESAFG